MKSKKPVFVANCLGFTLVELMITLAMSGIIVAAIYSAYIIQQKTYYTQGQVVEMQQNIRAGLEMMVSEIRAATYDPGGEAGASIPLATATRLQITMDLDNSGDVTGVNEDITYGLGGVDGDNNGVVDNIDVDADGIVDAVVDLTRTSGAGAPQAIAEGIQAIEFNYILDNDPLPVLNPTALQLAHIQAVQITLLAVSSQRDPKYTNGTTYCPGSNPLDPATGQCTNVAGAQWTPTLLSGSASGDNFRRRLLTTTVTIRNHGLK